MDFKSKYLDLGYSEGEGFSAALKVSGVGALSGTLSYSDAAGLTASVAADSEHFIKLRKSFSASNDTWVQQQEGGKTFGSMDALEGAVDNLSHDIQEEYKAEKKAQYLKDTFAKFGKNWTEAELAEIMNDPKRLEAELHKAGVLDQVTGGQSDAFNTSRDGGFWDTVTGGIEDAARGVFGGEVSDSDGFIDADGNYHQRTCFTAGTKVHMADGSTKPIETVAIGDEVVSFNEKTGEFEINKVYETFVHETDLLFIISYEDGTKLETTWNHPFWIQDLGWTEAKDLRPGDLGLLKDGEYLMVTDVTEKSLDAKVNVYNFEVENVHSYMVGEDGVTVHNYDVKSGLVGNNDTIADVQKALKDKYGKDFTAAEILAMNGLPADAELNRGQRIFVPENFVPASEEDKKAYFDEKTAEHDYESVSLDVELGFGVLLESGWGFYKDIASRGIFGQTEVGLYTVSPTTDFLEQFSTPNASVGVNYTDLPGSSAAEFWGDQPYTTSTYCVLSTCAGDIEDGYPYKIDNPIVGHTSGVSAGFGDSIYSYSRSFNRNNDTHSILNTYTYFISGCMLDVCYDE